MPTAEIQPRTISVSPTVTAGPDGRTRAIRVLLISHTCQSPVEGQPKAVCLGQMPDIQLKVIVPDRWRHYGRWRVADKATPPARFDLAVEKVRWPWAGPAQFYLHWYPRLRQILQEFRPDVIDLWEEPWGLVSAHACSLRNRLLPQTRIVSETEQNINKKLPFPFERFRSYTLRNADWAVGRNSEAVAILREKGYRGPADVVPNAVDAELFRPLDRDACRREIGVSGFVVGYIGRLVEEKGLTDFLDALARVSREINGVFVGSGPLQAELEQRAAAAGLSGRVRFLGNQPMQRLPRIMNALDALVLPSRTTDRWKEQFGRVIIEAHSCGVPVIGTESGAIPDVIGQAGRVVPERDPRALALAMSQLSANPEGARELGRIGRLQVEQNYTWQRVAERMASIYRAVVDRPRGCETGVVR